MTEKHKHEDVLETYFEQIKISALTSIFWCNGKRSVSRVLIMLGKDGLNASAEGHWRPVFMKNLRKERYLDSQTENSESGQIRQISGEISPSCSYFSSISISQTNWNPLVCLCSCADKSKFWIKWQNKFLVRKRRARMCKKLDGVKKVVFFAQRAEWASGKTISVQPQCR